LHSHTEKLLQGENVNQEAIMPKFVIEREMPGVGGLGQADLRGASQKSCAVLGDLGPQIQWIQSYVTDDKLYCVYDSPDEELIREHARRGGFPADRISRVTGGMTPRTAEGVAEPIEP
jgi:hypothetical protein